MTKAGLSASERFWVKVDPPDVNGCMNWNASLYTNGYGAFSWGNGKINAAHIFSWELHHGPVNGLCVLHKCDNRRCVNPDHLFLGTRRENTHDMMAKGRAPWDGPRWDKKGTANGRAKLDERKVNGILLLVAQGMRQTDAGAHYGVSQGTVSRIVSGVGWTHLAA